MAVSTPWWAPAALAFALGGAALATPTVARAGDDALVRVLVDVADVVFRAGSPYYRHGHYGPHDRLVVVRDRYGRPHYYRYVDDRYGYRGDDRRYRHRYSTRPPYGNAYGYYGRRHDRHGAAVRRQYCDARGRCRVEYYDPRYDRRHSGHGYGYGYGYGDWRGRD